MPISKRNDLKRFKKSMYGVIGFATLLEQASPARRQKILNMASKEDPEFVETALRKTVFFEELPLLDDGVLAEILSKVSPRLLAFALKKSPPDFKKQFYSHLNHVGLKQTLDEEEQLKDNLSTEFVQGAQRQILKIARQLEAQNRFVFELADAPRFHTGKRARRA